MDIACAKLRLKQAAVNSTLQTQGLKELAVRFADSTSYEEERRVENEIFTIQADLVGLYGVAWIQEEVNRLNELVGYLGRYPTTRDPIRIQSALEDWDVLCSGRRPGCYINHD